MVSDLTSNPEPELEPGAPKDSDKIKDLHNIARLVWTALCHHEKSGTSK